MRTNRKNPNEKTEGSKMAETNVIDKTDSLKDTQRYDKKTGLETKNAGSSRYSR